MPDRVAGAYVRLRRRRCKPAPPSVSLLRHRRAAKRHGELHERRPCAPRSSRKTNETDIAVAVDLDGTGSSEIATGIGFLDHMLEQLARHA